MNLGKNPTRYAEKKLRREISLTPTAIDGIIALALKLGLRNNKGDGNVSELVERLGRLFLADPDDGVLELLAERLANIEKGDS